eukprot:TRINITY_DN63576_c0_g1_i1.p2 TRINITY_DN63576_c0_g1~~TRINITY_DN63576_c0_g1_i1.p2  ORF type:complete len:141 (+),score=7.38 TRINITY_DN63576_c0_g1_i1:111-533(+)
MVGSDGNLIHALSRLSPRREVSPMMVESQVGMVLDGNRGFKDTRISLMNSKGMILTFISDTLEEIEQNEIAESNGHTFSPCHSSGLSAAPHAMSSPEPSQNLSSSCTRTLSKDPCSIPNFCGCSMAKVARHSTSKSLRRS